MKTVNEILKLVEVGKFDLGAIAKELEERDEAINQERQWKSEAQSHVTRLAGELKDECKKSKKYFDHAVKLQGELCAEVAKIEELSLSQEKLESANKTIAKMEQSKILWTDLYAQASAAFGKRLSESIILKQEIADLSEENARLTEVLKAANAEIAELKEKNLYLCEDLESTQKKTGVADEITITIRPVVDLSELETFQKNLAVFFKKNEAGKVSPIEQPQFNGGDWPASGETVRAVDFGNIYPFIEMEASNIPDRPLCLLLRGDEFDVYISKLERHRLQSGSIDISGLAKLPNQKQAK